MYPIDNFLNQLILSGLADYQVISLIEHHYLKLSTLYDIMYSIDENNIEKMECDIDKENDNVSIIIYLKEKLTNELSTGSDDFDVQVINNGDNIVINIDNTKFKNEEDLYETRFIRCKKNNSGKWS